MRHRRSIAVALFLAPSALALASPAFALDRLLMDEITRPFGLSHLQATEVTLLAIFLVVAAVLVALVVGRVLEERTFGTAVNTALALGGALGGLHLYFRHAIWHGGMNLGLSALACLTGAMTTILILSALRNWLLDETGSALAGDSGASGKTQAAGPDAARMRSAVARRPR